MKRLKNKEVWRDIPDYVGMYQVSNSGRVRSLDRKVTYSTGATRVHKGRVLKCAPDKDGYNIVSLCRNGSQLTFRVARLVLIAFRGNQDDLQVCHGNGINSDDRLMNLRWGTAEENNNDKMIHGTVARGAANGGGNKLDEKTVVDIVRLVNSGIQQKLVASKYGISPSMVCRIMNGEKWAHIVNA